MTPTGFTPEELSYLRAQPLGRLATVDEQHAPQVSPSASSSTSRRARSRSAAPRSGRRASSATSRRPAARRLSSTTSLRSIRGTCAESRSEVAPRPSGTSTRRGRG